MGLAIRSEFRKFFTTRMWWGMGLAVIVASLAFPALYAFIFTSDGMAEIGASAIPDSELAKTVYTGGIQLAYLLTLAIGVLTIGAEYRHKTITGTFLATPKRARVMLAKVVSLLGIGGLYGIASVVVGLLDRRDHPQRQGARDLAGFLGRPDPGALPARPGLVGPHRARHRHPHPQPDRCPLHRDRRRLDRRAVAQRAARHSGVGKGHRPVLPVQRDQRRARLRRAVRGGEAIPAFPWWGAALVLVAYAAIMAAVGTFLTLRRDVT
jgi:ABC-2 type transport system permease protein